MKTFKRKQDLKSSKGITLIALIITIIVLIILAGVTISALLGDDGIVEQAEIAEEDTNVKGEKEQIEMAYNALYMRSKRENKPITIGDLETQLNNNGVEVKSVKDTQGDFLVEFKSGRKYSINTANKEVILIEENYKYFTFTLDENNKTATITGVKDEYAEYSYYKDSVGNIWNDYAIQCVINDNGEYITDLVIPSIYIDGNNTYTVTAIGDFAFSNSTWAGYNKAGYEKKEKMFKSVTIPNTVTTIGKYAFGGQPGIEKISIPNSITNIGYNVFVHCSSLKNVIIPNGVTSIESNAFYDCDSLTSVTIPNSVTSIGSRAFNDCDNLETIKFEMEIPPIWGEYFNVDYQQTTLYFKNSNVYNSFWGEYRSDKMASDGEYYYYKPN